MFIKDSFGARSTLGVGDRTYEIARLDCLEGDFEVSRLPYAVKVLLENLLRHEGTPLVGADDVAALASWRGGAEREVAFRPARVLMQDFTGVPAIVDLAAMRDATAALGGGRLDPVLPVDLVIDHSVTVDAFGTPTAFAHNVEMEYARNEERYRLLRWAQQAFANIRVVPPGTGICHQVNLEYLAQVVRADGGGRAYPDTLVGTDSHTPMVNGLGVVGWGVGGIEAEAAILGQPVSLLTPKVIGVQLSGELRPGTTATDLVLTVTELLRGRGVVGKFVEFFGPGVAEVSLENRATLGNMSPEYGSTVTIFPVDEETLRYLRFTGRPAELVSLVEAYTKEQGLWHEASSPPTYTDIVQLDLSTVEPCLAGPARPQDRVPLGEAKVAFRAALPSSIPPAEREAVIDGLPLKVRPASPEAASAQSFPASDPPSAAAGASGIGAPDVREEWRDDDRSADRPRAPVAIARDGESFVVDHGHVVIAAITSCTNTSNPTVMLAAGLLAQKAVQLGLSVPPWVKTSLAPGSQVVMDYYAAADLLAPLDQLGFNLVGFGCTTCIGNSGPLPPDIARAVADGRLAVASVLSGNRNFEGRINPNVRMNYLMSPPLVVAYALAGSVDIDLASEPLGTSTDGTDVYLRDLWPTREEVEAVLASAVRSEMFTETYASVFDGDERWKQLDTPSGERFEWVPASTYVREPPFLTGMTADPPVRSATIVGARVLAHLGDSVTTDHISPAGAISPASPAGRWLLEQGVARGDFNSYGSRRGNHEVMMRGTFANGRIRNRLARDEGGVTVHLPDGEEMSIYDASIRYRAEGVPLIVLAGKDYGSGSSRDWAAKGTALLGVRAVLAESFERIHRSNLIGMGVLPLQYTAGESAASLGLTGREQFDLSGVEVAELPSTVTVRADGREFQVEVRIDTAMELGYYHHGGILPHVVRSLVGAPEP